MECIFLNPAGTTLFVRDDMEEGHWVQQEMNLTASFPFNPNKKIESGQRIAFRSQNSGRILNVLMAEPGITITALAKTIGINTSAIQKHLKSMTDKGFIARREKDGQWDVFIIPSA